MDITPKYRLFSSIIAWLNFN